MDGQPHRILRQVLEVGGCPAGDEARVRSEVRRICYQRLLPAMERACSALSADGRIHRVDVLEIDLGVVPLDGLESAIAERFDRVFARELAAVIDTTEPAVPGSELELFTYFIRTGLLPWWADRSDRRVLDVALEALIERAPRALGAAIRSVPDRTIVWRRLALTFPDPLLDLLVGVLAPHLAAACPRFGVEWVALLEIATAERVDPKRMRDGWWEAVLNALGAQGAAVSATPALVDGVLVRLARRWGVEHASLVSALHRAIDRPDQVTPPWIRDVVQTLPCEIAVRGSDLVSAVRDADVVPPLAAAEQPGQDECPEPRAGGDVFRESTPQVQSRATQRSVPTVQQRRVDPVPADQSAIEYGRNASEDKPTVPLDLGFSDADEIYVENAGLVILWPFLENFFARLGLLEERAFKDVSARERAVGLLQYLAAEDAAAREFDVPLNKVLCGKALEEPFDFGAPVTDEEADACNELLGAAIHHAPILRDMSIAGFRGTFLLRQGQLGVRDGHWLLRVQRETHDVVLDRFPWSVRVVRLPWMETLMLVEW